MLERPRTIVRVNFVNGSNDFSDFESLQVMQHCGPALGPDKTEILGVGLDFVTRNVGLVVGAPVAGALR